MILNEELSNAEKLMFEGLGWEYLFHTNVEVFGLYRMAVEKAFIENKNDGFTKALRVASKRLNECKYRGNKEHDNAILNEIHLNDIMAYNIRTNGLKDGSNVNQ